MPKFVVEHGERVSYETVIVEAADREAAEDIVRQSSPDDFNPRCEDGDNYLVEAVEAGDEDLKTYREAEVKDGAVVPFKPSTPMTDEEIRAIVSGVLKKLKNDDGDACLLSREDIEGAAGDIAMLITAKL